MSLASSRGSIIYYLIHKSLMENRYFLSGLRKVIFSEVLGRVGDSTKGNWRSVKEIFNDI